MTWDICLLGCGETAEEAEEIQWQPMATKGMDGALTLLLATADTTLQRPQTQSQKGSDGTQETALPLPGGW